MALIDDTKAILADLIAFPTVSSDSNLELIAYAAERLSACGASLNMTRDDSGHKANLFATIGPQIDGGIVLSGHSDVVPALAEEWQSDPFIMREADGLLYGRGTCDMKGFIAATLAMAPRYGALKLKRPIHFAFTYDEEVGCLGAQHLVSDLAAMAFRPSMAIIGEPTDMRIIEGHKGCYEYTTHFSGLEGHGSRPELGVNAVEYAVQYVGRMMELAAEVQKMAPKDSRFEPPWTTVQVGRISGGMARNVIPGHCAVEWEMRPVDTRDAHHIKSGLQAYCDDVLLPAMRKISPNSGISMQTIAEVAGLLPADENEARAIIAELTGQTDANLVAFGTEAGLFQAMGMSAVICGPGSIAQAHKPDEYIAISALQSCLDMLVGLEGKLQI